MDTVVKDSVVHFAISYKGDKIAYVKGEVEFLVEGPWFRLNSEDKIIFLDAFTYSIIKELTLLHPLYTT
ncbi:MAG: hypothetical protein ABDH49_01135 [Candidatus Hydrothermales bacterium]